MAIPGLPNLVARVAVYRASDGYLLHVRHWQAAAAVPRAQIVALHGIQSHGGWYCHSSRRLAEAGYEVFFLDRRGSGLNRIDRGHAIHEDRLINDVVQFLNALHAEQRRAKASIPVVLMGVSWGGKLATAVALRRPELISALALLYPGLVSQVQPGWWQKFRLQWAEAIGWSRVIVPIPLNEPTRFTHSTRWQDFIRRDELALHRVSVSFLLSNLRLSALLRQKKRSFAVPTLLMLAGQDDIIDNAATKSCLSRLAGSPPTVIEYPSARHTLEFEPDPEAFIDDLIRWLKESTR